MPTFMLYACLMKIWNTVLNLLLLTLGFSLIACICFVLIIGRYQAYLLFLSPLAIVVGIGTILHDIRSTNRNR